MEIFSLIILGLVIGFIASYWIIFTKAGESGWKCLVPIYNLIIMIRIAKKPIWWIILIFIEVKYSKVSILL